MFVKVLSFIGIAILIQLALGFGLTLSQSPKPLEGGKGLAFDDLLGRDQAAPLPLEQVQMRDGWQMPTRHLPAEGKPLLVLIHGSGWHGQQWDRMARALEGRAEILAPDLRGHGANPQRRGDIDHVSQFEEDLADLIAHYRKPGQKLVVAGHSSGGGLAVRFASGPQAQDVDHVVLLAPFLKHNAPTTRDNSGGWAHVLTRRMIGLSMLNMMQIKALNHLTVIQFAMPDAVLNGPMGHTATTAYSFRLNTGYAPRSTYKADIAALPDFTLIVGRKDEAFFADEYQPLMAPLNPRGNYHIIEGQSHLTVVDAPETQAQIEKVLDGL